MYVQSDSWLASVLAHHMDCIYFKYWFTNWMLLLAQWGGFAKLKKKRNLPIGTFLLFPFFLYFNLSLLNAIVYNEIIA